MHSLRIAVIAAVCSATAISGAAAQNAAPAASGKPLPLLQFVGRHEKKTALRAHSHAARTVAKKPRSKRRVARHAPARTRLAAHRAARSHTALAAHAAPAPTATGASPANIWPGAAAAAATAAPPPSIAIVPTMSDTAAAPASVAPSAQLDWPRDDSPLAAAADDHRDADKAATNTSAERPVVRAAVVATAATVPETDPVGSASWIAHVMAALAGAITAGLVAWLMIRPARTYG